MTSLLNSLCGWSNSLITQSLIRLLLSWKAFTILNHYSLPNFPYLRSLAPSHCLQKQHRDLTSGGSLTARLPGFCIKSACGNSSACCVFLRFLDLSVRLSERLLGSLLHKHLADVCAICAFSQQVITNRRLTSHSVQLDSLTSMVRASFKREKDDNSWIAYIME